MGAAAMYAAAALCVRLQVHAVAASVLVLHTCMVLAVHGMLPEVLILSTAASSCSASCQDLS